MPLISQIHTAEEQIDNITQTVIAVGAASVTLLAANTERKFLRIKHQSSGGTAFVYVKFAAVAATSTNAFELSEGQLYEEGIGVQGFIYTGEVRVIASAAGRPVYVEERF